MSQDRLCVHVEYLPMHGENIDARISEVVSAAFRSLKELPHVPAKSDVVSAS